MTLQEAADAYASACNEVSRADRSRENAEKAYQEADIAAGSARERYATAKNQLIEVARAGVEAPSPVPAAAPKREPRTR